MPSVAKIFIIIFMVVIFLYVIVNVKHNKLNIQNALIWMLLPIGVIIAVLFLKELTSLAELIGIRTLSNLLFFLGFIFLILVCFNITKIVSIQKMIKENKEEIVRILKYVFSSGTSFVLDLLLFTIFQWIFSNINLSTMLCIFLATIFSRTMSSLYNYFMNSRFVFNNKDIKTIVAYFILVIIQMFMSAFLVSLIERIVSINATIIKFFVDIVIFIINYIVQKTIIFN